jgi:hypothetical protein
MTDLLDEINEDLKTEKHTYITKKVAKLFTMCAVVMVVSVSVYAWKSRSVEELQSRLGMWFNQAVISTESDDLDGAIVQFDKVIQQSHQQYAALASLNKAAILIKQNKFEQAQKILLEVSSQDYFDKSLKDLAKVIFLGNQLNSDLPESELTSDMLSSISKEGRPWQLSGLQLKALYAIKHKNFGEAKENLNKILDSKTANKSSHDTAANILSVISRTE